MVVNRAWQLLVNQWHCAKSVRIWSHSGPNFPAFGLNTERYVISLLIQSECRKMQTRITRNSETFHAVWKTKLSNKSNEYFLLIRIPHHSSIDHIKFQLIYQFFWFHAEKLIREHNPYIIFFSFINKPVTAINKPMTSDALIKSKTFCSFIQFLFY